MKCIRKGCKNEAIKHQIYGILPCQGCQDRDNDRTYRKLTGHGIHQLHRIQAQQDKGAKDLIQPFNGNEPNPDFAKAYPKEAPKYYSKKELKRL